MTEFGKFKNEEAQMSEAAEEIQRLTAENEDLETRLAGMTEARDRYCESINRVAEIVGLSGKQSFAPEAVERQAKYELATLREERDHWRSEAGRISDAALRRFKKGEDEVLRLKKAAVECDHRVFGCPVVTPEEIDLLDPAEIPLEEKEGSAEVYGPGTIPGIDPSEEVVLSDATGPVVAERAGTGFVVADDEDDEEQPIICSLCSCVIGSEVSFAYNMAPGEPVCDNRADGGEDEEGD